MGGRRRLGGVRWLAIAVMAVVMLLGVAASAYAAEGKIRGRVTNAAGEGIPDMPVEALAKGSGSSARAFTDGDGYYEISTFIHAPGGYVVAFLPADYNEAHDTDYVATYFGGTYRFDDATVVFAGDEGIDAQLEEGVRIEGVVTGEGSPLEGVYVYQHADDANDYPIWASDASTDDSGAYIVRGVPASEPVILWFDPWQCNYLNDTHYMDQYFEDAIVFEDATPIIGGNPNADVALVPGAMVWGRVTGEGGAPLEGVGVDVTRESDDRRYGSDDDTDVDGYWEVWVHPDTPVIVYFTPGRYNSAHGTSYLATYYKSVYTPEEAKVVNPGTTSFQANQQLIQGKTITGTVTAGGAPASDVSVAVFRHGTEESGVPLRATSTGSDGRYRFDPLAPGEYTIRFAEGGYHDEDTDTFYSAEWWNGRHAWQLSDVIVLDTTADVVADADLDLAASIVGRVTAAGNVQLEGIEVIVQGLNNPYTTTTDVAGDFEINGLEPGPYKVFFDPWEYNQDNDTDLLSEYWDDERTLASATVLGAEPGGMLRTDVTLDSGTRIAGTVVDSTGTPISDVDVWIHGIRGSGRWVGRGAKATTGPDGRYVIRGVEPGSYKVEFDPWAYNGTNGAYLAREYYNDRHTVETADRVSVDVSSPRLDVDATLEEGGRIEGTVRALSRPLKDVNVYVEDTLNGILLEWDSTEADGSYSVGPLPPGEWTVYFDARDHNSNYNANLASEYYNHAYRRADAQPVGVEPGEPTTGIDAYLSPGAILGGSVYDGWRSLDDSIVRVYDSSGELVTEVEANVGAAGWKAIGLPPGDYVVEFDPSPYNDAYGTTYVREYWKDKYDFGSADVITLSQGGNNMGLDAQLGSGAGSIGGVVTGPGGVPYTDPVTVVLYEQRAWGLDQVQRMSRALPGGAYTFENLPPGDYRVAFYPDDWRLAPVVYDAQPVPEDMGGVSFGTPVTLGLGQNRSDVNAVLKLGGRISGRVSDAGGNSLLGARVTLWFESGVGDWREVASDHTGLGGRYSFTQLLPGNYKVQFIDESGTLGEAWYLNRASMSQGVAVALSAGGHRELDTQQLPLPDGLPPVTSLAVTPPNGQNGWYVTAPTIVLTASEPATIHYQWDDGPERTYGAGLVPPEGEHTLTFWSVGTGGAVEHPKPTQSFKVDLTPPSAPSGVTATPAQTSVLLSWNPGSDAVSGVRRYAVHDAASRALIAYATGTTHEVTGLTPGTEYRFVVITHDNAGRQSADSNVVTVRTSVGNRAPVARADRYQTRGDGEYVVPADRGVLQNDTDADGDMLTADRTGGSGPSHGTVDLSPDGSFAYTPEPGFIGTDTFTYRAYDGQAYSTYATVTIVVNDPSEPAVTSIEGADRIKTAIKASAKAFPDGSAKTVVIATAYNWPDALGGAALAGAVDGPILLTRANALPGEVLTEIRRLGATKAYLLGGPSAVQPAVETALKAELGAGKVTRLAGTNRYETARIIAAECVRVQGGAYDGTAFIATGVNFPDALGASPLAAAKGWPIYLVNPTTGADATLTGAMKANGVNRVLVLGGTTVITDAVRNGVAARVPAATVRLFGANRYETAVAVASYGVSSAGLSWDQVAIATGQDFPDALAGGVLQGRSGSVMLLTPTATLDAKVRATLIANMSDIDFIRFLGGPNAVSAKVRKAVQDLMK